MEQPFINRITLNPDICHGKPTIRNKRYPVDLVLDLLAAGMTEQEILEDYPALEKEDILACLAYAPSCAESSAKSSPSRLSMTVKAWNTP